MPILSIIFGLFMLAMLPMVDAADFMKNSLNLKRFSPRIYKSGMRWQNIYHGE
jgi:hypothetical protein